MIKGLNGKLFTGLGGVALLVVLALAPSARADLEIALAEDGGPAFTVVSTGTAFTSATFTGGFGDFTVTISSATATNGAALSKLLASTLSVTNNDVASHTLHVYVTETGYTSPAGSPLNVESGMGGSVATGTLGMVGIYQGFADKTNTLFGMADFTTGPQNATPSGSTFDTGSASGSFARVGPFSLTNEATLAISGGGDVNYSDHVNVTALPLPATASMGLGLFGLIAGAAGLNALRRRNLALAL